MLEEAKAKQMREERDEYLRRLDEYLRRLDASDLEVRESRSQIHELSRASGVEAHSLRYFSLHVCVFVCVYICMYIYIHIMYHIHTYIHTYIHTHDTGSRWQS